MALELKMSDMVKQLNDATKAYDEGHPVLTDEEWDNLYFILQKTEQETGVVLPDSPTQNIYFEVKTQLDKVQHNHKMLSLDKTKDFKVVQAFMHGEPTIAMCKMDGLTCSLHYKDGHLLSAETRGDGIVGEDITHNARVMFNVPRYIAFKEDLIIDGEVICDYNHFTSFNNVFKNPRNFAAGSLRLLNSFEFKNRNLSFVAWEVIQGLDNVELLSDKLKYIKDLGFTTVPFVVCSGQNINEEVVNILRNVAASAAYPIDGVVFKFNNVEYGKQQGETSHHFKNAIAYKFYDESVTTELKDIEWTMGRTGTLTPVAIFEPVELDGATIERASLHNVSVLKSILGAHPWRGQKIDVFKANMIIPQIENAEQPVEGLEYDEIQFPKTCPLCGGKTEIVLSNTGVINMICTNLDCAGQLVNRLDHMCGKKGLDIKGLSKATLEKLINWGYLQNPVDIFYLKNYRKEWINQTGFGEKSVDKILDAIETSKHTDLVSFISSIGIPMIGNSMAKIIAKNIPTYEEFKDKVNNNFDFSQYESIGIEKRDSILNFDYTDADLVWRELIFEEPAAAGESDRTLDGQTFVITGRLKEFKNRDELVAKIEELGGKVAGSVSSNTKYLINNDKESTSSKNLAAKKLGIPILSEQDFLQKFDIK